MRVLLTSILALALAACDSGFQTRSMDSEASLTPPEELASQLQSGQVSFNFVTSPQSVTVGKCSGTAQIQLVNANGSADTFPGSVYAPLSSNGNMIFYSDAACKNAISYFTLNGQTGTGQFYFIASAAGNLTMTA